MEDNSELKRSSENSALLEYKEKGTPRTMPCARWTENNRKNKSKYGVINGISPTFTTNVGDTPNSTWNYEKSRNGKAEEWSLFHYPTTRLYDYDFLSISD